MHTKTLLVEDTDGNPVGTIFEYDNTDENNNGTPEPEDDYGQLIRQTRPNGTYKTFIEYFVDTNQAKFIREHNVSGAILITYEYDQSGNLIGANDFAATYTYFSDSERMHTKTLLIADDDGNPVGTIFEYDDTATYDNGTDDPRDDYGRLIKQTRPNGTYKTFTEYFVTNVARFVKEYSASDDHLVTYEYNELGEFVETRTMLLVSDFNLDGRVDLSDFAIIRRNFGTAVGATRLTGDTNRDGKVDSADYGKFISQLGRRNIPSEGDTILYDADGNLVIYIVVNEGYKIIFLYDGGLFTRADVEASGIKNPQDYIVDPPSGSPATELEESFEETEEPADNEPVIQGDQEVLARLAVEEESAAKRDTSDLTYYNDLKSKKTKYLDWLKN